MLQTLKSQALSALLETLPHMGRAAAPDGSMRISFGVDALDDPLSGGLTRGALHEVFAAGEADSPAATGFVAAMAIRAAGTRPIVWVRQDFADAECGRLYPPGLAELGLEPAQLVLVRARDGLGVLKAGAEAARCPALGVVLIEPWGEHRLMDLTASRRLALAAACSGTPTFLLRIAAEPAPSAADTRWRVRTLPSQALEANAPGHPAFALRLVRHRGGLGEREWCVEWNRDKRCFQERREHRGLQRDRTQVSRPVVSVSDDGSLAA